MKPALDRRLKTSIMTPQGKKVPANVEAELETGLSDRAPENGKMEQVRDLLFGSQMREFERKLRDGSARLEGELAALSRSTLQHVAELEGKVDGASEKALQLLRQEADVRNKAIEDLEDRISQLIRTVRGEVMARMEQLQVEISRSELQLREAVDRVERDMAGATAELRSAVARSCEDLEAGKLGKRDLAGLLAELSLRLADEPAAD